VLFRVFGVQVRSAYRDIRAKLAKINVTLNEYLSGIRVIKIFRQEKTTLSRFENLNHDYYRATLRQIMLQAIFFPCIELLATTTIALLLWYGGRQVLADTLKNTASCSLPWLQQSEFFSSWTTRSRKDTIPRNLALLL
jgi:ABC-type multidrug transport system fused ATPase/permease subunit